MGQFSVKIIGPTGSLLSGNQHPWDTYKSFYQNSVSDEGRIILDLRAHKLADALPGISEIGFARFLEKAANNSADRVMIAKHL
ncbi:MAG: hypothetical protein MJH10_08440 [Epibacterium sp.]|nr:hypothetical protein [Epibacterium sp.]NQX73567.1 hypothetical protein [Epibacterium sp.]